MRSDVVASCGRDIIDRLLERFGTSRRECICGDLDLRAHLALDLSCQELRLPLELDGLRRLLSAAE